MISQNRSTKTGRRCRAVVVADAKTNRSESFDFFEGARSREVIVSSAQRRVNLARWLRIAAKIGGGDSLSLVSVR